MTRILQLCLYKASNFGDRISRDVLSMTLQRFDIAAEVDCIDLAEMQQSGESLDHQVNEINLKYDCIILGTGGMLCWYILDWAFKDPENWRRLRPPLVLFGIGIIHNLGRGTLYTQLRPDEPNSSVIEAIKAATLIAVRDNRSALFVQRMVGGDKRTYLTGCPSLQFVRGTSKTGDAFLINIPFKHGPTREKSDALMLIARRALERNENVVWLCHSQEEVDDAKAIVAHVSTLVDIIRPETITDVGAIMVRCNRGIAVKAHPAYFMLANNVPFGLLAYDYKCQAMMEMLDDEPMRLITNISHLDQNNAVSEADRLMDEIDAHHDAIRRSQWALRSYLDQEFQALGIALQRLLKNAPD
jgi:hypothetical protein